MILLLSDYIISKQKNILSFSNREYNYIYLKLFYLPYSVLSVLRIYNDSLFFFFFLFSISYLLSYSQVASLAARLLQYAAIINHPTVCQRSISTLFGTTVFGTELLNKYPIKSVKVIRKFRYPGKHHQS